MKKLCLTLAMAAVVAFVAGPAMAGKGGKGNGAPEGGHYNLNIIGVEKGKTVKMTGSERHTIFVRLGRAGDAVETRIHLQPGDEFRVCDGNGFDIAYACDEDVQLLDAKGGGKDGAVFMLPCNLLLPQGGNVNGDPIEVNVNCNETYTVNGDGDVIVVPKQGDLVPVLAYEVWGRALGKPGDGVQATMQTCATVTEIEDWFWSYQNEGVKLVQLRFYPMGGPA